MSRSQRNAALQVCVLSLFPPLSIGLGAGLKSFRLQQRRLYPPNLIPSKYGLRCPMKFKLELAGVGAVHNFWEEKIGVQPPSEVVAAAAFCSMGSLASHIL